MAEWKVIIADDEVNTLEGLKAMLGSFPNAFEIAGAVTNGAEALALCRETGAELLLTDIRMPIMDGIELTKALESEHSRTTVVIISAYDDRKYLQYAIRSPIVFDYVLKPFHRSEFMELIASVAAYIRQKKAEDPEVNRASVGMDDILSLMRQGDADGAERCFRAHWSETAGTEYVKAASEMMMHMQWSMRHKGDAKSVFAIYDDLKALESCSSADEAGDYVAAYICRNGKNPSGNTRVTSLVSSCLKLLDERFSDQSFGIAMASELLSVTPNYLSARFSRDMGISFTRYLTLLRLQKATEYLLDSTLKVYQISDSVGFVDCGYFDRVFKDNVGETPSEYRSRILRGGK